MRRLIVSLLICAAGLAGTGAPRAAGAEKRPLPYEAVVSAEQGLYVRSGPGPKYYPTSKLKRGDRVLVQRHDPGGWYMIVPPPGSFSWIPAKYVQVIDNGRGTVTANNVIVRVGSFESDIRDLFQRKLSQGDEVRILGEKALPNESGAVESWYRIEPPKSEWRWIMGKYVAAVAPGADLSAGRGDPFDTGAGDPPRKPRSPVTLSIDAPRQAPVPREYDPNAEKSPPDDGLIERPLVRKTTRKKSARGSAEFEREEIERLDARLQAILEKPPSEWDFDHLEQDYRGLRQEIKREIYQTMIDGRLSLIDRKKRVRAQYLEIERLGEETLRRDAELAALQREHESRLLGVNRQPAKFDGAGVIQRAAGNVPGAPPFVLLAPNGRVLAYLHPAQGVDLAAWVGKSAGVFGPRTFREDLKTDLLVVNSVTAVRLAP